MTPETLADLFEQHRSAMAAYAQRLTDTHGAEDAIQEAFLRILLYHRPTARPVDLAYVLLTIKNVVRRTARRDGRSQGDSPLEGLSQPAPATHDSELPPALARSLARLKPAHQASLILTSVHGLDCGRAAQSLGLPPAQVWRQRQVAVRTLRSSAEDWLNRPCRKRQPNESAA